MSFFNFFSGDSKPDQPAFPWIPLEQVDQIDEVIEQSYEKPVVIFKHSTRCSISRFALRQWESQYISGDLDMHFYFIDLLNYRKVSNEVAIRFQVVHQSPQILFIRNGKCVYHESHDGISLDHLRKIV